MQLFAFFSRETLFYFNVYKNDDHFVYDSKDLPQQILLDYSYRQSSVRDVILC